MSKENQKFNLESFEEFTLKDLDKIQGGQTEGVSEAVAAVAANNGGKKGYTEEVGTSMGKCADKRIDGVIQTTVCLD